MTSITFQCSRSWIVSVVVVIVAVYLYFSPSLVSPNPYYYPALPVLEGHLQKNTHLQKAKRLFEGQLVGPESFTVDKDGTLYTGVQDGSILSFRGDNLQTVTRMGEDLAGCGSFELEPVCGRPKGLKIDSEGNLIVLDSYKGLFKVHLQNASVECLIPSEIGVDGTPFYFLNGLDISTQGLVYFTDSTTRWQRHNYRYEVLEVNRLGRLIEYNPATKSTRLILDQLYLANGVALSKDESFLLVAEMSVCRILRYYLRGPKAGQTDIFADNLPGYPDNIKINNRGNFYVGVGAVRYVGMSKIGSFLDLVGPYPVVKQFIAKIIPLSLFDVFVKKHAILIEYNHEGQIVGSLQDPTGQVIPAAGEGFQHENKLYIGNFKNPFIGQLDLTDIT